MFYREQFLVDDRVAQLRTDAARSRLRANARSTDVPHVAAWRMTLALALFSLADVVAGPARREDACADCG